MIFARGALRAALWARGRRPGFIRWPRAGPRRPSDRLRGTPRRSDRPLISTGWRKPISSSKVGAISASRPSPKKRCRRQQQHRYGIGRVSRMRAAGFRIAHQFAIAVVRGDQQSPPAFVIASAMRPTLASTTSTALIAAGKLQCVRPCRDGVIQYNQIISTGADRFHRPCRSIPAPTSRV